MSIGQAATIAGLSGFAASIVCSTERQAPSAIYIATDSMTHIYVQTYCGIKAGWRNIGGRRTRKDAARFCALLSRVKDTHSHRVAEVPVTFVLGE